MRHSVPGYRTVIGRKVQSGNVGDPQLDSTRGHMNHREGQVNPHVPWTSE